MPGKAACLVTDGDGRKGRLRGLFHHRHIVEERQMRATLKAWDYPSFPEKKNGLQDMMYVRTF